MSTRVSSEIASLRTLVGTSHASIPQVLAARVDRTPDRLFLRASGHRWTYASAWHAIRAFGGFLAALGIGGPTDRVASYLSNRPEALWTWFGTHVTGAVYAPLNRAHRGQVLEDMLRRSTARILVTEASALDSLPPLNTVGIETVLLVDGDLPTPTELGARVFAFRDALSAKPCTITVPKPGDLATLMYTSGTTGRSKAARLPHSQFCRGGAWVAHALSLTENDVLHGWMPLFHIAGQLHITMSTITAGAVLALFPTFSRSRFWTQVHETQATVVCGMGALLRILWNMPPDASDRAHSLRIAMVANIPPDLHLPFEQRFGIRLVEQYGMTEAELLTLPTPEDPVPLGSCGRPGPDFDLAIMDAEDRILPPRKTGQIVARPKVPHVMMLGYEGDDAATVDAWGNLWFHTGDLGYCDESGCYYWVDRLKHAIRRRGENISSWEVEQILRAYPGVHDCAVVGVPSPLGEEDVKAVVTPQTGHSLAPGDIHAFCARHMARFMVPRYIEIRSVLPYSEVGKVEKERLRQITGQIWDAERDWIGPAPP
jgi:crotonobetaine/carnitine-CoA ligase